MSKEKQNKKNDGQNRCRRCDRPLSDPTANYGWWCAQILRLADQTATELDSDGLLLYNAYTEKYLSDGIKNLYGSFTAKNCNYNADSKPQSSEILNVGYDSSGVWHDWDADEFGIDSAKYQMLVGLMMAYENAYSDDDRMRIAELASTLRVTDTTIVDVILLNNSEGASGFGHNGLALLNPYGQALFFSYYPETGSALYDEGEMRFSVLSVDELAELKDMSGIVASAVTINGDRRWEDGNAAYDRFAWSDISSEQGEEMFRTAASIFINPGMYNLFGNQCDNTANEILSAGDNGYWVYAWPDTSYETFKKGKVHWRNQNGINRGIDI